MGMENAVYMDHNATAAVRPEARDAVSRALAVTGNPSSVHGSGRTARRLVEDARDAVAALVGAEPAAVVFTSGGRTLVDNVPATLTHAGASTVSATTTHAEGDFAGLYIGTAIPGNDITTEIRSGRLKGLIDLRDDVLANLQSEIDEMAAELRDVFNQIHNRGVSFPGMQSMTGTRIFVAPTTQTMTLDPGTGADDDGQTGRGQRQRRAHGVVQHRRRPEGVQHLGQA